MTGEDKERTNNITVGIKWLKEHGFHRDTRCREARAAANPPGEAWKRGFEIDVLNWHYLERRRFYMVVFQYKANGWPTLAKLRTGTAARAANTCRLQYAAHLKNS